MRRDVRELAAIFVGGAIGALARTYLARHAGAGAPSWPWATFAANIVGAFLLGYFATRLQERLPLSKYRRPLLGTGFSAFWLQGNVAAEGLWQFGGIVDRAGFSFHNTPIELRVALGWIGMVIYFATVLTGGILLVRRFIQKPTVALVLFRSEPKVLRSE